MSETPASENEAVTDVTTAEEAGNESEAAPEEQATDASAEASEFTDGDFDGDGEEIEEVETTLYRVVVREDEQIIDGRIEAVDKAKEISVETGQSVLVERTDGRVKMNFRDGALIDYVLETRKGRRA
ncbi:MAG: hypothetical protein VX589_03285 [Myxococcota bacterium]|nr:hypothetical protein [Myxococcota bacterium]